MELPPRECSCTKSARILSSSHTTLAPDVKNQAVGTAKLRLKGAPRLDTLPAEIIEMIIIRIPFDEDLFKRLRAVCRTWQDILASRESDLCTRVAESNYPEACVACTYINKRTSEGVVALADINKHARSVVERTKSIMLPDDLAAEGDDWEDLMFKSLILRERVLYEATKEGSTKEGSTMLPSWSGTDHDSIPLDAHLLLRFTSARLAVYAFYEFNEFNHLPLGAPTLQRELSLEALLALNFVRISNRYLYIIAWDLAHLADSKFGRDLDDESCSRNNHLFEFCYLPNWKEDETIRSWLGNPAENSVLLANHKGYEYERVTHHVCDRLLGSYGIEQDDDVVKFFRGHRAGRRLYERDFHQLEFVLEQAAGEGDVRNRLGETVVREALDLVEIENILVAEILDPTSRLRKSMAPVDEVFSQAIAGLDTIR